MVPNIDQMNNQIDNPVRSAAIHFGVFLQLKGLLQGEHKDYGKIERKKLFDQFINHYQPKYRTYLVLSELLTTLRKYQIIPKSRQRRKQQTTDDVRIVKHPHPENVKAPDSVPRHRIYVDQSRVLRERLVRPDIVNELKCRLCNVSFKQESKDEHVDSDIHKFRCQYREKRSSFKSNVSGASMDIADLDDKDEIILRIGERCNITVRVALDNEYTTAAIYKIMDLNEVKVSRTEFQNNLPIEVNVSALFNDVGAYNYPLVAKIMPAKICLLKDLIFRVESELMDQLAPVSPYIYHQDVIREMEGAIIPGEQLEKSESKLLIKVRLGEHKISPVYNKLVLHKLEKFESITAHEEDVLATVLGLLCGLMNYREAMHQISLTKTPFIEPLDCDNYSDRFRLLVDLEELQQQRQVKNYDRSKEILQQRNTKFFLRVPDLSEGRPSVTKGDRVHMRLNDEDRVTYEGIIHETMEEGLLLGCHREFQEQYSKLKKGGREPKVDVRFTVNRFPILNMHRALTLMSKHKAHSIVFPVQRGKHPKTKPPILKPWVNRLIGNNPEQQRAIEKIISKSSGNAPYLVFGPPGTGKTVTLVETIVQVWLATQTCVAKQLVCAPSNAACNNIAERLIKTLPPTAKILRLFSFSTEVADLPACVLKHSNFDKKQKCIYMPTIEEIMNNHIIIVTIVSSGRLVTGGAGGSFQYVYIDECGQASEPESLIAIAGVLTKKKSNVVGQLVLSGDPKQLGPILSSQLANDFGLGMSLLERLMIYNPLYQKDQSSGYDSNYLTKLVQNFRSHPVILRIPNELFYDSELEVKGNPDIINRAVGWKGLPNPKFPLIFHGVQGCDERESNSPSYFNRQEIDRVIIYLKLLFKNGLPNNYKVKQDDIGVISPYRKQVRKFHKAFDVLGWDIRVGSVEEFQGSEKLIIFISTVRSTKALVEEDYRFKLGFLKNPKRFNVSVTRAQALLIVVGNPNILRHDKQWYKLLNYCHENGAYVGIPFPEGDPPENEQEHIAG